MNSELLVHSKTLDDAIRLDWLLDAAAQVALRGLPDGNPDRELILRLRDAVENALEGLGDEELS